MASYSRLLLRMLPLRRWPLHGLGPVWLSDPQPACRVLWPSSHNLMDRVVADVERQMQDMEKMTRAFFQAAPLLTWERESQREPREESATEAAVKGQPDGKHSFSVDVTGFSPEEMTVKLDGRKVTVTAKRQRESQSEGGSYWQEHQELRRETLLPPDVDLQAVSCSLTPDGQLCIEAPRLASSATTEKAIPIDVQSEAQNRPSGEEKEPGGSDGAKAKET
ncbi:PREDICTED: heat shock protein 30C-like [Gekko japonicus]|uniref:Heat shock protein 30C-like n=1 Tax=Gekko japonicus TaxID=146911 RepID=A0ABM1LEB6_GEKJA|nr:PREDICTED: heat shock protein 30C-like [Gekko japonicus]